MQSNLYWLTERQTDRQTDGLTDRQIEAGTERPKKRERMMNEWTELAKYGQTDRQTDTP